jgi:hypothetical protein
VLREPVVVLLLEEAEHGTSVGVDEAASKRRQKSKQGAKKVSVTNKNHLPPTPLICASIGVVGSSY